MVGNSAEYVKSYQQTLIVSSRDYAAKNPETARGVLAGYAEAVEWISANPKEAAEFWAKRAGLGVEDAGKILDAALSANHWGVAYNPEALEAAAKGLMHTKGMEQVDWKALLTDEYLPEGKKALSP